MKHSLFTATLIEEGMLGDVEISVGDISVMKHKVGTLVEGFHNSFHFVGQPHIVLVAKENFVALCVADSVDEVCNNALAFALNVDNTAVLFGEPFYNFFCHTAGLVVRNDDFIPVGKLRKN